MEARHIDWGQLLGDPALWIALWVVAAGVLSAFPSRRKHWPLAYALMAAGLPVLVWAFAADPRLGLVGLLAGALVLRWPLRYALRRLGLGRPG